MFLFIIFIILFDLNLKNFFKNEKQKNYIRTNENKIIYLTYNNNTNNISINNSTNINNIINNNIMNNNIINNNYAPIIHYNSIHSNELLPTNSNTTILLVAIVKLENNYIREWVEHYKSIKVNKIVICDNNYIGGEIIEEPIQDYINSGFVIIDKFA